MPSDERHASITERFRRHFGRDPAIVANAPGRINLIGEHTDHQQGLVLPAAVDLYVHVAAAPRSDDSIVAWSERRGAARPWSTTRPLESPLADNDDWATILRGVTACFFEPIAPESPPRGLDVLVAGTLPLGAGLSSSAALGVAYTSILERATDHPLPPLERARLAHRAETEAVGVPCGIMDPFAVVHGRRDCALELDCRSETFTTHSVPRDLGRWIAVHSGIERDLRSNDRFAERTRECRAALDALRSIPGIESLRDVDASHLPQLSESPTLERRARHVVRENERVGAMVAALAAHDTTRVGALLDASHASLRDDFDVSLPAIDDLVALAREEGALGSRLMGGGFGGCTLNLVPHAAVDSWIDTVTSRYREHTGHDATAFPVWIVDGAS